MKRTLVAGLVFAVALLLIGSLAYAHWGGRGGAYGKACVSNPEAFAKFKDEAAPLREALMSKRAEMRAERHKQTPDTERLAQLREEMAGLRTQIHSIAEKYGIDAGYLCGRADCPGADGKHRMGYSGHGRGMMGKNCPLDQQ
ncbi:MAG: hypothetical protein AB1442_00950 [Nitrospirota bacterium]